MGDPSTVHRRRSETQEGQTRRPPEISSKSSHPVVERSRARSVPSLLMRRRLQDLFDAAWRAPKTFLTVMVGLGILGLSGLVFLGASEDVIQGNGAEKLDAQRLGWIVQHRSGTLVAMARILDTAASVPVVVLLALALGIWLWRRGLPVAIAGLPLASFLVAESLVAVLKPLVGRARPGAALRLVTETEPSFPSGHATGASAFVVSAAVIVAIFVLRRPLGRLLTLLAGLLLPALVAGSRLELGVHWPTDVVAGLALGVGTAVVVGGVALWIMSHPDPRPTASSQRRTVLRARLVALLTKSRWSDPMVASS